MVGCLSEQSLGSSGNRGGQRGSTRPHSQHLGPGFLFYYIGSYPVVQAGLSFTSAGYQPVTTTPA